MREVHIERRFRLGGQCPSLWRITMTTSEYLSMISVWTSGFPSLPWPSFSSSQSFLPRTFIPMLLVHPQWSRTRLFRTTLNSKIWHDGAVRQGSERSPIGIFAPNSCNGKIKMPLALMNRFKSAIIPATQVIVLLIVHIWYISDSPRGIWKHARKTNARELWNSERDLVQIEARDLYIEYAARPEIFSDFQQFHEIRESPGLFNSFKKLIHASYKNWSMLPTNFDLLHRQ
jgi:hypothetical protein